MTDDDRVARYLKKVVDNVCEAVAGAGNGGRSTVLAAEAFRMGILVGAGVIADYEAERLLLGASNGWDRDENWTDKRILDHIKRGLRDGTAKGKLEAVLPAFARDWTAAQVESACRLGEWIRPSSEDAQRWRAQANKEAREADRIHERAMAEAKRLDLIEVAAWALHGQGFFPPETVRDRQDELRARLVGPQLELADLLNRGLDMETVIRHRLGRVLWPALPSEKFPNRQLRTRRSILIPYWGHDNAAEPEYIQFRHVDGLEPKYHWLERSAELFGAENLRIVAAGGTLVVVEGALCALRLIADPRMPHQVVGLPSESGWRRAYSRYKEEIDRASRIWILPDAVPPGSKSRAIEYAHQFATALGDKARVVTLSDERDPDEWLNEHPDRMLQLLAELDKSFDGV